MEDLYLRVFCYKSVANLETDPHVLCLIESDKKMSHCARVNILTKTTVAG